MPPQATNKVGVWSFATQKMPVSERRLPRVREKLEIFPADEYELRH